MEVVMFEVGECFQEEGQKSMEIARCVVRVVDRLTKVGIRKSGSKSKANITSIKNRVASSKQPLELTADQGISCWCWCSRNGDWFQFDCLQEELSVWYDDFRKQILAARRYTNAWSELHK